MKKYSVIIPCRNMATTLGEALEGLVAQQVKLDWEIVLADNGSTDETLDILKDYARRNPQTSMRVVDASAKRGSSHARNVAIHEASGERLLLHDADDVVAPGWLAAMARALDRHDLVAARIDFARLNSRGSRPSWVNGRELQKELGLIKHAPHCRWAQGGTLGLHRRVFENVGEFDPDLLNGQDMDWCIRAHLKGYKIVFVPEAVYYYRLRTEPEAIRRQEHSWAATDALLRKRYADPPSRGLRAAITWTGAWSYAAQLMVRERIAQLRGENDLASAQRRAIRLGKVLGDIEGARFHQIPPLHRRQGFGRVPRWLAKGTRAARLSVTGLVRPTLLAVHTDAKALALTFDDGPDPATTPVLLDLLAQLDAKATFFLVGKRAERHPQLVARIASEGHEIGNHSWSHPSFTSLPKPKVTEELIQARDVLQGYGRALMRPPFNDANFAVNTVAQRLGYTPVIWNVNAQDCFDDDAETIAGRVLSQVCPGAIVLLHDSLYSYVAEAYRDRGPTLNAVEQVVRALPDWRFVTISQLISLGRPFTGGWHKTSPKGFITGLHWADDHEL